MHNASSSKARNRHRPGSSIPLAVVACAVAIAACGSSGKSSSAASSSRYSQALKLAVCMRSHGVPNYPDPSANGGGGLIGGPKSGISIQSPAFQAAEKACAKLQPSGGGPPSSPSASTERTALAWARCIRKHGVPNFPDPSTTAEQGLIYDGLVFPVGSGFNPQSLAYKQAQAACGVGP